MERYGLNNQTFGAPVLFLFLQAKMTTPQFPLGRIKYLCKQVKGRSQFCVVELTSAPSVQVVSITSNPNYRQCDPIQLEPGSSFTELHACQSCDHLKDGCQHLNSAWQQGYQQGHWLVLMMNTNALSRGSARSLSKQNNTPTTLDLWPHHHQCFFFNDGRDVLWFMRECYFSPGCDWELVSICCEGFEIYGVFEFKEPPVLAINLYGCCMCI